MENVFYESTQRYRRSKIQRQKYMNKMRKKKQKLKVKTMKNSNILVNM